MPALSEVPFTGRADALARLDRWLEQALAGDGVAAFVAGEPGAGKTTLVQEFCRRAQQREPELLVAFGDCNPQTGAGDAYLPFREILALLTGDVDGSLAERTITSENASRLRRFVRTSGGRHARMARRANGLLPSSNTASACCGRTASTKRRTSCAQRARAALSIWEGLPVAYPLQWVVRLPLLAALLPDALPGAVEQAHALLDPSQQPQAPAAEAALRRGIAAFEGGAVDDARNALQQAVALAAASPTASVANLDAAGDGELETSS